MPLLFLGSGTENETQNEHWFQQNSLISHVSLAACSYRLPRWVASPGLSLTGFEIMHEQLGSRNWSPDKRISEICLTRKQNSDQSWQLIGKGIVNIGGDRKRWKWRDDFMIRVCVIKLANRQHRNLRGTEVLLGAVGLANAGSNYVILFWLQSSFTLPVWSQQSARRAGQGSRSHVTDIEKCLSGRNPSCFEHRHNRVNSCQ